MLEEEELEELLLADVFHAIPMGERPVTLITSHLLVSLTFGCSIIPGTLLKSVLANI